jgi:hypothetical protein
LHSLTAAAIVMIAMTLFSRFVRMIDASGLVGVQDKFVKGVLADPEIRRMIFSCKLASTCQLAKSYK